MSLPTQPRTYDRSATWMRILAAVLPLVSLAAALAIPDHLPFVDFPQHVALVSIWSHFDDPARGLAARYEVNLATPYLTGYLIARFIAPFVGDEAAVRTVLFLSVAAIPVATLVVLRAYRRPQELAIVTFTVAFSWMTFMGFVEFIVAVPMIIAAAGVSHCLDRWRWAFPALIVLAIGAFATHALALPMLVLVSVGGMLGPGWRGRVVRGAIALLPAIALATAWAITRARTISPDPMPFTMGSPAARLAVPRYVFGSDIADARVVALTAAVVALWLAGLLLARREAEPPPVEPRAHAPGSAVAAPGAAVAAPRAPGRLRAVARRAAAVLARRPLLGPTLAAAAGYALVPLTALDAYGLWQRFAPIAFALGVGLAPWPRRTLPRLMLTAALVIVATASSIATVPQSLAFDRQIAGLDAIVQQLPPGKRLFYDEPDVRPAGVGVDALRHLGAEYLALRGGDISYNFTMFPHLTIRDRLPRTLATQSTRYDIVLRFVDACAPALPPAPGPLIASAGRWQAFTATTPLERPPSRSLDSLPQTEGC